MSYDADTVRAMWYGTITSGMNGLIIPPPNSTIVTGLWKDSSSVLTSTIINSVPSLEVPLTPGGSLVRATLDADGNYALLDAPNLYPIALVYIYEVAHKDFDRTLALFGRVYQDDIGRFDFYKTNAPTFTLGVEYTEPYEDNHASPKKYVDDIELPANQIKVLEVGESTYDDVQDYINTVTSAGRISGGDLSGVDTNHIKVTAGVGVIKISDSSVAETKFFDWEENSNLEITTGITNYIYTDYNIVTGVVTIAATVTHSDVNRNTQFIIGATYSNGTATAHVVTTGMNLANWMANEHFRFVEIRRIERASGGVISEAGSLGIDSTAGVFYVAGKRLTTLHKDSSGGTDKITYVYKLNGVWAYTDDQTVIDNLQYNDVSTPGSEVLAPIGNAKFGVHWIYILYDGVTYSLYGQDSYSLSGAQAAQPPGSVPSELYEFGILAAKIIILRNTASFYSIDSAYITVFTPATVSLHNDLGELNAGDYQHLLEVEYTELSEWLDNVVLGNDGLTSVPEIVLVPRASALSDTQGGMHYSSIDDSIYVCTSAT